jgi:soluble lytic murein transglycosylase-like protein
VKEALLLSLLCCRARRRSAGLWPGRTVHTAGDRDVQGDYYSRAYSVPLEFVQAVIDVESAWQPYVVSAKGTAGLMQLMPPTALRFGVTNRFCVEDNVRGGVAYLAYLMRQFDGDLRLVAAAYYAGEQCIKRQGLRCADTDICRYVREVQRLFAKRQAAARTAGLNSIKGAEQQ